MPRPARLAAARPPGRARPPRPALLTALLAGCHGGHSFSERGETGTFCFREDTGAPEVEELYKPSGCHFMLVGDTRDGDSRIVLDVPVFVDLFNGQSVDTTYVLPDATVRLDLEVGCDVSADWCGDEAGTASVSVAYAAVTGTVAVTGTPDTDGAVVTAVLTDVGFAPAADPGDIVATIDTLTWADVRLTGP